MKGNIYVGYDASRGFKIGKSINPYKREKQIRHMNPSFKLLAFGETPNQEVAEKYLHDKYANKRIIGEWFNLSPEDVSEIIGRKLSPEEIEKITGREL